MVWFIRVFFDDYLLIDINEFGSVAFIQPRVLSAQNGEQPCLGRIFILEAVKRAPRA